MAQHEVTGSAGHTPRQGQEFDWWSASDTVGSEGTDERSSGFPGESVHEPIHELIQELMDEPIHDFMRESVDEFAHEAAQELIPESLQDPQQVAARQEAKLAARQSGGRPQRTGSTDFADQDDSARSVLSAESSGAASAIPAQRPSGVSDDTPSEGPDSYRMAADVYREVQQSQAFQQIRRSHRRFVFPATAVFVCWYLFYVTVLAAAPGLMRTRLFGPFSVAWLLGLMQFASTFVITWLYARNARIKRDRAALGLRWDTQDQLR